MLNNRLIIRKTREPNHAKLYLFLLNEGQAKQKILITGSSNLTRPGLMDQNEFNVEISDYGIEEAEKYFDTLWNSSIPVTEDNVRKNELLQILTHQTLIKEITPFEAYCLVLKAYLESYEINLPGEAIHKILLSNNYVPYRYQLDAIAQALSIIEKHNGVILADVVGLGKTIIACAIAFMLKKRGIVICPPGLIGNDNKEMGWKKYLEDFRLYDWEVRSSGKLEEALEFVNQHDDIEVVIVDEAHRFRNQDTRSYELLKNICRNKKVILLTATPFNNRPSDIFSLIKLFVTPRKSTITLENNLELLFSLYKSRFDKLSYIKRYYKSPDKAKKEKANTLYQYLFGSLPINIQRVNTETHRLAKQIRDVIEPVTIRRNRIDLQNNPFYKKEVAMLSVVKDPIEWFYELTYDQSKFYDTIIENYFSEYEGNGFKGAIYRPFIYEEGELEIDEDTEDKETLLEKNREYQQQRNLFNFMRRLLVKRFESSFGAFKESIERFKNVHEHVLQFIHNTGNGDPLRGKFILDRSLIEKIYDLDSDEIEIKLQEYEKDLEDKKPVLPKKYKIYEIKNFKDKNKFIDDIKHDIQLFDTILNQLNKLDLVNNDPKLECLVKNIKSELSKKPNKGESKRKIVIFSEFKDTVDYLTDTLNDLFNERVLVVAGDLPDTKIREIYKNFDASYPHQEDNYDILLCTDKLSEGFNLNRSGMIINYDIPWNPVRVIQRLGRINRISKKVFDELYIVNFFPTEKGAEIVKSREIAQNKMFMIHNTLGEDAKIFDEDEEPTPAELYNRLQQNPETYEMESFYTRALNIYEKIKENNPEIIKNIENVPLRVKVSKKNQFDELLVFFKKNRLFVMNYNYADDIVSETTLEEVLERIKCNIDEKCLPIDERFWDAYEKVKSHKDTRTLPKSVLSVYQRAKNKLQYMLSNDCPEELKKFTPFIHQLLEDLLDYGTLSDYTLRRIANLDLNNKNENKIKNLIDEIHSLQQELGSDYLNKIKHKGDGLQKEIIIAIENKNTVI